MALPNSIDPAAPAGADALSGGANQIRALKQFLVDVFGLPTSPTAIQAALMAATTNGLTKLILQNLGGDPSAAGEFGHSADILKYHDGSAAQQLFFGKIARKTAPQNPATTTLTDDTDLFVPMGANEVWRATFDVHFTSAPANGFKCAVAAPSGATGQWDGFYHSTSDSSMVKVAPRFTFDGANPLSISVIDSNSYMIYLRVTCINGGNMGNLRLQFADANTPGFATSEARSLVQATRIS